MLRKGVIAASSSRRDPFFENVSLLLKMDGTNGSTTFLDSSKNAFTVIRGGSAVISTTQSKFGGSSAAFLNSNDNVNVASNAAFGFATNNFTVEMWVFKSTSITNWNPIFGVNQYTNGLLLRIQTVSDSFYINNTSYNWNPSINFPLNQWNHIALVRNGNLFTLYVNGTSVFSTTNTSNLGSSAPIMFGGSPHSLTERLGGYIDEVRVTKGVARYTSNFTPPIKPF